MLGLGYDDDLARLKRDLAEAKAHEIIAARTKTPEARCKQIIETAPIESPLEHLAFKPPE